QLDSKCGAIVEPPQPKQREPLDEDERTRGTEHPLRRLPGQKALRDWSSEHSSLNQRLASPAFLNLIEHISSRSALLTASRRTSTLQIGSEQTSMDLPTR